jgi:hypothetical protein
MRRLLVLLSLVPISLIGLRASAWAGAFDVIFVDSFDVTLCRGCGITLAGLDYALLVNTGTTDITLEDLEGAAFTVTSSMPEIILLPFINIPNPEVVGAIHPGEAVGSIIDGNQVLLAQLKSGETLRNLERLQFMAFQVDRRGPGAYEGPVDFEVRMTIGDYEAQFSIHAEVHLGEHSIVFLTVTRAMRKSALLRVTPTLNTTWGELKRRYR